MASLQQRLRENHTDKTKAQLIELLQAARDQLGPDRFRSLSQLDDGGSLDGRKKEELLEALRALSRAEDQELEQRVEAMALGTIKGIRKDAAQPLGALGAAPNSPDFAAELGAIDFSAMITGPMNAAIDAQTQASLATANFVKEFGFTKGGFPEIEMVDFSYKKAAGSGDQQEEQRVDIKVPFISILNIPSLRIDTLDIDFNVKLESIYTQNVDRENKVGASVGAGWGPVKMSVSASHRSATSSGTKVEREYSMNVKVRATNDQLPAGLERVLGLMNQ